MLVDAARTRWQRAWKVARGMRSAGLRLSSRRTGSQKKPIFVRCSGAMRSSLQGSTPMPHSSSITYMHHQYCCCLHLCHQQAPVPLRSKRTRSQNQAWNFMDTALFKHSAPSHWLPDGTVLRSTEGGGWHPGSPRKQVLFEKNCELWQHEHLRYQMGQQQVSADKGAHVLLVILLQIESWRASEELPCQHAHSPHIHLHTCTRTTSLPITPCYVPHTYSNVSRQF